MATKRSKSRSPKKSKSRSPKKSLSPKKRSKSRSPSKSLTSGYCVKCRKSRDMKRPHKRTAVNGRHMMCGVCPSCGTKMCRFIKG